jgi:hypothetical protein
METVTTVTTCYPLCKHSKQSYPKYRKKKEKLLQSLQTRHALPFLYAFSVPLVVVVHRSRGNIPMRVY